MFELSKQTWLVMRLPLWIILMGGTARAGRAAAIAGEVSEGDDLDSARDRLTAGPASAMTWLSLLLLVVVVYLTVFQPFVRRQPRLTAGAGIVHVHVRRGVVGSRAGGGYTTQASRERCTPASAGTYNRTPSGPILQSYCVPA